MGRVVVVTFDENEEAKLNDILDELSIRQKMDCCRCDNKIRWMKKRCKNTPNDIYD